MKRFAKEAVTPLFTRSYCLLSNSVSTNATAFGFQFDCVFISLQPFFLCCSDPSRWARPSNNNMLISHAPERSWIPFFEKRVKTSRINSSYLSSKTPTLPITVCTYKQWDYSSREFTRLRASSNFSSADRFAMAPLSHGAGVQTHDYKCRYWGVPSINVSCSLLCGLCLCVIQSIRKRGLCKSRLFRHVSTSLIL